MFIVKEHEKRDIYWWFNRRHTINFKPSYQRKGGLWDMARKAQLIDSIINGYDLPKLYLVDFTSTNSILNEAEKDYAVVDGKQRLETIFGFLNNEFPLAQNFKNLSRPSYDVGGLRYFDLLERYPIVAEDVTSYILPVMSIVTDEKERIDEMYVRLNTGISLNGAEVRNAMPGIVPGLLRKMVVHAFFKENVSFSTWRMQDFNVAAKLLLIEYNGQFTDTKRSSLDRFTKNGTTLFPEEYYSAYDRCITILDRMHLVFRKNDGLLRTEAPVLVYYWLIRNCEEEDLHLIWDFLKEFNSAMGAYRRHLKNHPMEGVPLFDRYYEGARSSNDPTSMHERYRILEGEFARFKRAPRLSLFDIM